MSTLTAKPPKERPLVLPAPDVRDLLDGRMTSLRRVVWYAPKEDKPGEWSKLRSGGRGCTWDTNRRFREVRNRHTGELLERGEFLVPFEEWLIGLCPLGRVGDLLWVRETWSPVERDSDCVDGVKYRADDAFVPIENTRKAADAWVVAANNDHSGRWRPSTQMPRWASRLVLKITEVTLDDISAMTDEERLAKGFPKWERGDLAWRVGFERVEKASR